jgi:hypothetical protein
MKVICVIDTNEKFTDPVFKIVETHCNDMDIEYDIRGFQSWRIADDRDNITKLPAFHIYTNGLYQTTFYTNDDVISLIESYFQTMKDKEKKRREAYKAWKKYFIIPKTLFRLSTPQPLQTESNTIESNTIESNPMHE